MECPVCKEPMIVLESEAVEVDFCVECEGIWLDAGEIELLFGDRESCSAFLSIGNPVDAGGEKQRHCPACQVKMTKEATESDPPVLFDHCHARTAFRDDVVAAPPRNVAVVETRSTHLMHNGADRELLGQRSTQGMNGGMRE